MAIFEPAAGDRGDLAFVGPVAGLFCYRTQISRLEFLIASMGIVVLLLSTIFFQLIFVNRQNPTDILRYE